MKDQLNITDKEELHLVKWVVILVLVAILRTIYVVLER